MNKFLTSAKNIGIRKICSFIWYYFWGHILGAIFYKKNITMGNGLKESLVDWQHLVGNGSA